MSFLDVLGLATPVMVGGAGALCIGFGLAKLRSRGSVTRPLVDAGLSRPLRLVLGSFEVLAGAALIVSVFQPILTFFVAACVLVVAIGVVVAHVLLGRHGGWQGAALLVASALVAALMQPLGLRILMLPTHADLPQSLVPSETLAVFEPGASLESLRFDRHGNLFLSKTIGIDPFTGDVARVVGEIVRRTPEGKLDVFFRLPPRTPAGVLAFGVDGALYLTANGEGRGLWRILPSGEGKRVATFPPGSFLNGVTVGPDAHVYVADSARGVVWRIAEDGSLPEAVLDDERLAPRRFIALAPGINGAQFVGDSLYMTVSDKAQVLKATLQGNGRFGPLSVVAEGIPGDDFAVARNGDLFVTTHPYDTVARISRAAGPGEARTVIARARQGIAGAADATFGVRPGDELNLYVVTDGGAFAGIADAKGTLVRLTIQP